jgi:drug/metabolite transporter (DMT)-like permease
VAGHNAHMTIVAAAPTPRGPATEHRPLAAALWMTGSIASFTAMAVAARQIKGLHDTFEIMAARSFIGFFIVIGVCLATGKLRQVQKARLGGHLLRNSIHFTGQNLWFWALTMIPLAQVFALEFTSPIWVIILSPLLLGERITRPRLIAAGLGFIGILIVARPDFSALNLGVLAAAAAALCFALTNIATKSLTRNESIVSILFWLTLMQLVMGATLAAWDGQINWPTPVSAPWLMLIGGAGVLAHLCLTSALRLAPATFIMPIDFARLPLIAVIGALFYGEPLEALLFAGAALIVLGNLINIRAETRRRT